ncbi:MAG: hypothetical protein R3A12_15940 [Ignavibacteria bacterium]
MNKAKCSSLSFVNSLTMRANQKKKLRIQRREQRDLKDSEKASENMRKEKLLEVKDEFTERNRKLMKK